MEFPGELVDFAGLLVGFTGLLVRFAGLLVGFAEILVEQSIGGTGYNIGGFISELSGIFVL